jgi:exodeoxyribonuclease-1
MHTFLNKLGPITVLGHNIISFDMEAYIRQLYKNLIPDVYHLKKLPHKIIDTLNIARATKLVDDKSINCEVSSKGSLLFKLGSLCEQNNIKHDTQHEALSDVMANAELASIMMNKVPEVWKGALATGHKSDAQKLLEKNKILSHVAYFYGKARWYGIHYLFLHPIYNWACCWDLREPVEPYLKLGYKDLQKAMKKTPKFIRTIKQNRNEILLDGSHALKSEPYCKISTGEINKRIDLLDKNPKFLELMQTILRDQAEEKKEFSQKELIPEERLYLDGFPSESDKKNMELFHKLEWKDRLPLIDKFSEKYRFFAATLFYENHPELLPKPIYNEIHREFARRLLSTNDENFETVGKFYKELDDYRNRFDKQNNTEGLQLLDEYDSFVQDIEKRYQNA